MKSVVVSLILIFPFTLWGQDSLQYESSLLFDPEKIEVDFLAGYYEQEGNHSVVTGGIGTEELADQEYKIIIRVPVDSSQRISFRPTINHYTSASTDKIDSRTSASKEDFRTQFYFDYEKVNPVKRRFLKASLGGSGESDYSSKGLQASWTQYDKKLNQSFTIGTSIYFDDWVMIFPEELRNDSTELPTRDKRNSYSLSMTYSTVINQRMRASLTAGLTLQEGLLSTPFHRTFFQGRDLPKLEKLPETRWKVPITAQVNYFPIHFLVLKLRLRQYWDSFQLSSQTVRLETVWKTSPFVSFYPFYRLHLQQGAKYFAPFASHDLSAQFFTSDFDLSSFTSHHFGLGVKWKPLRGIWGFQVFRKQSALESLNFRVSRYYRSDGLSSYQLALAASFGIKR